MLRSLSKKIVEVSFTHPITFMSATLGVSVVVGLACLGVVEGKMEQNRQLSEGDRQKIGIRTSPATANGARQISQEEARVRAMIENAKESDWRQNLSNAIEAQHHFMLPPESKRNLDKPEFLKKIDRRTEQMMIIQREELSQQDQNQKLRKQHTTKYWEQ